MTQWWTFPSLKFPHFYPIKIQDLLISHLHNLPSAERLWLFHTSYWRAILISGDDSSLPPHSPPSITISSHSHITFHKPKHFRDLRTVIKRPWLWPSQPSHQLLPTHYLTSLLQGLRWNLTSVLVLFIKQKTACFLEAIISYSFWPLALAILSSFSLLFVSLLPI